MQGLLDDPRGRLTSQAVSALLSGSTGVSYSFGVDLLDSSDQFAEDITDTILASGLTVSRTMANTVHGQLQLQTTRALQWGRDRLQPYQLLSAPGLPTARFNLGVFVVTSPAVDVNRTNLLYPAVGWDKIYLLTSPVGDSYTVPAGTNVLAKVTALIAEAGAGTNVRLDGTKATAVTAADKSYPLGGGTDWRFIDIINDLLKSVAYRGLWADQDGAYRSEPDLAPALRSPEFILGDGDTPLDRFIDPDHFYRSIVRSAPKVVTQDRWGVPNWWRFVQNGLSFAPIEGSGQYTVTDLNSPTGSATTGMVIRKPVFLDATDQASLVAQGDLIVAADKNVAETITLETAPLPIAGHADVLLYSNPRLPGGTVRKVVADSWSLQLAGLPPVMSWGFTTVAVSG